MGEMFHETLMEPTAYHHFVESGTFRDGTMLALILHGTGENGMPARRGRFAADVHGGEMAVKDTARRSRNHNAALCPKDAVTLGDTNAPGVVQKNKVWR